MELSNSAGSITSVDLCAEHHRRNKMETCFVRRLAGSCAEANPKSSPNNAHTANVSTSWKWKQVAPGSPVPSGRLPGQWRGANPLMVGMRPFPSEEGGQSFSARTSPKALLFPGVTSARSRRKNPWPRGAHTVVGKDQQTL